jgi:hypothetical protein
MKKRRKLSLHNLKEREQKDCPNSAELMIITDHFDFLANDYYNLNLITNLCIDRNQISTHS